MQFLKTTHIHFIKQRKLAVLISGALILISIISLALHGGPRYGIDFTGGVQLRYHFENNIDEGDIRDAILNGGIENPTIKKFSTSSGKGTDILIFVQQTGKATTIADGSGESAQGAGGFPNRFKQVAGSNHSFGAGHGCQTNTGRLSGDQCSFRSGYGADRGGTFRSRCT